MKMCRNKFGRKPARRKLNEVFPNFSMVRWMRSFSYKSASIQTCCCFLVLACASSVGADTLPLTGATVYDPAPELNNWFLAWSFSTGTIDPTAGQINHNSCAIAEDFGLAGIGVLDGIRSANFMVGQSGRYELHISGFINGGIREGSSASFPDGVSKSGGKLWMAGGLTTVGLEEQLLHETDFSNWAMITEMAWATWTVYLDRIDETGTASSLLLLVKEAIEPEVSWDGNSFDLYSYAYLEEGVQYRWAFYVASSIAAGALGTNVKELALYEANVYGLSADLTYLDSETVDSPTGVTASDGAYINRVIVIWNTVSDAEGYDIYRNTTNNSDTAIKVGTNVGEMNNLYEDTSAIPGAYYYYWIRSKRYNPVVISQLSNSDSGYLIGYSITASSGLHGSIDPTGVLYVAEGTNAIFSATPEADYVVDCWFVDGEDSGGGASFLILEDVQSDRTVLVTFKAENSPSGDIGISILYNGMELVFDQDGAYNRYRSRSTLNLGTFEQFGEIPVGFSIENVSGGDIIWRYDIYDSDRFSGLEPNHSIPQDGSGGFTLLVNAYEVGQFAGDLVVQWFPSGSPYERTYLTIPIVSEIIPREGEGPRLVEMSIPTDGAVAKGTGILYLDLTFSKAMDYSSLSYKLMPYYSLNFEPAVTLKNEGTGEVLIATWNAIWSPDETMTYVTFDWADIPAGTYVLTINDSGFIDQTGARLDGEWSGRFPTGDGSQGGDLVHRFTITDQTPASKAINPSPSNGATSQSTTLGLSWTNGGEAASYNIYFGTDTTPDSGEYKSNQSVTTYNPGILALTTTYYWRIDAKNSAGTITTGDVWGFTTEAAPNYTLSISVSPSSGGSVTKNPNKSSYSYNESVQLTAIASSGYTFSNWIGNASGSSNPTTITMNSSKIVTANFTVANPTVSIIASDSSASEPADNGYFTVSRTGSTSGSLQIGYTTSGTATPGTDYMALAGFVDIPDGQLSAIINVVVIDDDNIENSETVIVGLAASLYYDLGQDQATVTITDDDEKTPPEISGLIPEANSIQVARDTVIQLHITDSGSGVEYDGGTVTIHIEGDLVYDGANESPKGVYNSTASSQTVRGVCTRTGTPADYTFVFQPSIPFDYEQKVDVAVVATDVAGNKVAKTYYFYTEMRAFAVNTKVNSDIGLLVQNRPATAVDSSGNIWVVWDQTTAAGDTDIYIGELIVNGDSFETSVPIVSNASKQRNPAIAIDGTGRIYVVWEGNDTNGNWDIFVSTSTNGIDWSKPVQINTADPPDKASAQTSPAIAIDGNNKAYVAWEDERAGNKDIWVATSTGGTTWSNAQVTTLTSDQSGPAIAIDASNIAYIVWIDRRNNSTTGTDIYSAASGTGPWNNVPLIKTASNQSSPVCASSGDDLHLLWIDDADANGSVFYASVTGGLQGTVVVDPDVVDERAYRQANPAIAVKDPADQWSTAKVFTCWTDSRWINDGDNADIYFAETASSFGTGPTQTKPAIGINKDSNPYVVWVDDSDGNNDIYYAGATAISGLETDLEDVGGIVTVRASTVDSLQVTIPAGALPERVDANNITIGEVSNLPAMPATYGGFGMYYEFGPSGLQFNSPVTIRIPHTNCPADYSVYRIYRYDPSSLNFWSDDGIHNPATHSPSGVTPHYLEVQVDHFSIFSAGGSVPVPLPIDGGGGGGGGGGCALSTHAHSPDSVVEFLLPYLVIVIVLLMISRIDARRQRKNSGS